MGIMAIGDIHGCSRALDALLEAVGIEPIDQIITLGEYVDRGPDSRGVIQRLLKLRQTNRLIALRGNHELMMLDARTGQDASEWLRCGGRETVTSYSAIDSCPTLSDVPDEHWDFLENYCVNWHETDTHFFVHANAYPDLALEEQPPYMLFWEQIENPPAHNSGKIMVCGHTPQKSGQPLNLGHAICLDTWAHGRGWLTCLDVTTGQYWQATESGKQRTAWIDELADSF
jgi:serine/threonine protein phosphatase 1